LAVSELIPFLPIGQCKLLPSLCIYPPSICGSIYVLHFELLLENLWTKFKQNLQQWSSKNMAIS